MSEVLLPTGTAGWIVKPRLRPWVLLRLVAFPIVFLALPLFLTRLGNIGPLIFEGTFVVLLILSIGLYLHNQRFMADRSSVTRVNSFGRLRTWPLSSIQHVDRFTLRGRYTNHGYMAFMDPDGKALFTLTGQYWDTAQIEEICSRIGLRLTGDFGEVVGIFEAGRRLGRRTQRRMFLYAVFVVLGAAAAALVFAMATNGH